MTGEHTTPEGLSMMSCWPSTARAAWPTGARNCLCCKRRAAGAIPALP